VPHAELMVGVGGVFPDPGGDEIEVGFRIVAGVADIDRAQQLDLVPELFRQGRFFFRKLLFYRQAGACFFW
jgi:hypothetical protein